MVRIGRRILAAIPAVAVACVCLTTVLVQDACILAEPSGDLPRIPESRPIIVQSSVVPSGSAVLSNWPSTFLVPVELTDPSEQFVYATFVDYNPLTGEGLVEDPRQSVYEASNNSTNTIGRTRTLTIAIPEPLDPDRCHTIEVLVALHLASDNDLTGNARLRHTPLAPGGDTATWFYNPSGDLGGCPTLDAGIEASTDGRADADADAGEGGAQ